MAGSSERPTRPITSSDTIAILNNVVIPAIHEIQQELKAVDEIQGDVKVIDTKIENIRCDTTEMHEVINKFRVTLYGNGDVQRPGLIAAVTQIQSWIDARSSYEKIIVSALIGEFLGLIFLFAKEIIGF